MNLYMQQIAVVRTVNEDSEIREIERGFREGNQLSPL